MKHFECVIVIWLIIENGKNVFGTIISLYFLSPNSLFCILSWRHTNHVQRLWEIYRIETYFSTPWFHSYKLVMRSVVRGWMIHCTDSRLHRCNYWSINETREMNCLMTMIQQKTRLFFRLLLDNFSLLLILGFP